MPRKKYSPKRKGRGAPKKHQQSQITYNQLAKMMKQVSLKQCETLHYMTSNSNVTLEHNEVTMLDTDLLWNQQGDGASGRSGDRVFARGVKLKMYFENQQYRPFARYRIIIFRNRIVLLRPILPGVAICSRERLLVNN